MKRLTAAFAFLALFGCAPSGHVAPAPAAAGYDVIIEGGRVIDGTGAAWFHGDVGIRGDRIARVAAAGALRDAAARERIDARGMVVSPGFIDIQSHSRDPFLTGDGRSVSKVTQGITTEIMGEGWTNAPANEQTLAGSGDITDAEMQALSRSFMGPGGFGRWLEAMQSGGVSPNIGSFAGASTIRAYGRGLEMGDATPAQVDSMRKALRWAMEDGAFGLASALIYPPGNYTSTEELIEVSRAMSPYGGLYITHMRSEADHVLEAIRKMSSAVATRLSLDDRGVLRQGMYADVVVFDPETVADRATFDDPHQLSEGIRDVFVNGTAVVRNGRHTGATPGVVVRGPGWTGSR